MWILQRACEIQASVDQTGKPNIEVSEKIGEKSEELHNIQTTGREYGALEFNAMLRKIELIDPSYKD